MESLCPKTRDNYVLLDFSQFCEEIRKRVEMQLGTDCEATIRSVRKNNNTEQKSILIRQGQAGVLPAIYLESFYREYTNGLSLTEIAESVIHVYEKNKNPWPDGLDFSYEGVKNKIAFRLVNYEKNAEQLADMPFIRMDELAVCFECVVCREGGNVGAVKVENRMLSEWGIALRDLVSLAKENSAQLIPPKVEPIEEVLAGILIARLSEDTSLSEKDREEKTKEILSHIIHSHDDSGIPMYVLSNTMNHYGAGALLNIPFMDSIREKLKEDFYILPSSIHELILIPASAAPGEERMLEMVREVNRNEVPKEEFLGNEIYRYGIVRQKIGAALNFEL